MSQNKIYFYNTLGRKLEKFKPIKTGEASIYSCGPTVYSYQHIGNLRSYIFADILKKTLIFNGYQVNHIINITDVGHLTSDTDEGEDKIEKASTKEGKTAKEIADYYFDIFEKDLEKLNIAKPNEWPKASEHIKEQIELIEKLEKNGFTYKTADGIYFDTSKFPEYGKLSGQDLEAIKAGSRVDLRDKKNPTDFALWKFSPSMNSGQAKRQQEWESPWGIGFPGWHLECSAMSMKYLGETIDIHTGGEDHVNIHHTNEIAQSEGATGKKFVNYWLHGAFLTFSGEKISKSKGGLYTLDDLEKLGYKPMHFRYLILGTHYRKSLDFSLDSLNAARDSYERIQQIIYKIKDDDEINEKYLTEFQEKINNDLDTPGALAILWDLLRDEKAAGRIKTIAKIMNVLSLSMDYESEKIPIKYTTAEGKDINYTLGQGTATTNMSLITDEIKYAVVEREQARESKNWKRSDELRNEIKEWGYLIEDTPDGPVIKKIE
jgi:cysteinyl-tRNA synthetase